MLRSAHPQPPVPTCLGPPYGSTCLGITSSRHDTATVHQATTPCNSAQVPLLKLPPQPFVEGEWVLQDKVPVTAVLHKTLTEMLTQMNRAIEKLADLSKAAAKA